MDRAEPNLDAAELFDGRARTFRIVLAVLGDPLTVEKAAGPGEGLAYRIPALEETPANGVDVGREIDRLSGELVIEGRRRRIELDYVWRRGRLLRDSDSRVAERLLDDGRRRNALYDLGVVGEKRQISCLLACDRLKDEAVEIGTVGLPVAWIPLKAPIWCSAGC